MDKEYLDIVDEEDKIIGKELRSVYYSSSAEGRYIRYVNVLVFNKKGHILLPLRSLDRSIFPGCYDFSCGEHVQEGEDYNQAVIRGMKEELGIVNPSLKLLGKLGPKDKVSGFMQIYCFVTDKDSFDYEKEAIEKLEWFEVKKILELIEKDESKFKDDLIVVLEKYARLFDH
jgi:isopentenyl-diphosphate delta-isomerase